MQVQMSKQRLYDLDAFPGNLFVISGSSAVGKTTVMYALCERLRSKGTPLVRIITYTTRKPRAGEMDGVDYHFIAEEKFHECRDAGFFIEWSCAYGAYYGSPASLRVLLVQGASCIIVLDREGVKSLRSSLGSALFPILIFTNRGLTRNLIQTRGTEDHAQQELRSRRAQEEKDDEQRDPLFYWHIENQDITNTVQQLEDIIIDVQKQRLLPYKSDIYVGKDRVV